MADTGAPWNLPYPLPTDLVRDGADAIKDLAEAAAAGLDLAGNPGIGSNVVQTVKTDTFTTTSGSYVDVTGLDVTITPSSNTSRVLFVASLNVSNTINNPCNVRVLRNSTVLSVGDADGVRVQAASAGVGANSGYINESVSITLVDSPGTSSAVTYKIQVRVGSASTAVVNRFGDDANSAAYSRFMSTVTAIEVAA